MNTTMSSYIYKMIMITAVCVLAVCTAYPLDGFDSSEVVEDDDLCTLCVLTNNPSICSACLIDNSAQEPLEKRGHMFNPLLRGRLPKKSTYIPYNPLFRGAYNKKSPYNPGYNPLLRGGYGG